MTTMAPPPFRKCELCLCETTRRCASCKRSACGPACQLALGCRRSGCVSSWQENMERSSFLALPDEVLCEVLRHVAPKESKGARLACRRLRVLWDEAHAPAPRSDERPWRVQVASWSEMAEMLVKLQCLSTPASLRRLVIVLERADTWRCGESSSTTIAGTHRSTYTWASEWSVRAHDAHNNALRDARMRPEAVRAFMRQLPEFARALAHVRVDVKDVDKRAADIAMLARVVPFRDVSCRYFEPAATRLILESLGDASSAAHATLRSLDLLDTKCFRESNSCTGAQRQEAAVAAAAALARLSTAPRLAKLDLSYTGLCEAAASALAPLANAPSLRELIIRNSSGLSDATVGALAPLARSKTLEVFTLTNDHASHSAGSTNGGITALADALARPGGAPLRTLDLSKTGMTSAGAVALARIKTLEELLLRYNRIGDEGAAAFALHPRLRALDLCGNSIGAAGAEALLREPPPLLETLSLRTQDGFRSASEVRRLARDLLQRGVIVYLKFLR